MKKTTSLLLTCAVVLALSSALHGQQENSQPAPGTAETSSPEPMADSTAQSPKTSIKEHLPDFIADGRFILDVRPRYEYADRDGFEASNAFTIRTRLGYETAPVYGLKALLEFEDVTAIGNDDNYNQAGLSGPGKTVVADPEDTEINRAWIGYENFDTMAKVGRQRITLDNQRFVGNVGWRQNEQTFDAVSVKNQSLPDTTFFYGYVNNVNRIFGDDHPLGDWDSDSHLANISYSGCPYATLTGYAYFLDLENDTVSSETFGASLDGSWAVADSPFTLSYRAEYAYQQDAADNPFNYDADYLRFELGGAYDRFSAGAGYELLGSGSNGVGFSTPLATLHAFNGWADTFLNTPANGLQDIFVWAGVKLPYDIPFKFVYHRFSSDTGGHDYGQEWDAVISRKFGEHWTVLAKLAIYHGEDPILFPGGPAPAYNSQKYWVQVAYSF